MNSITQRLPALNQIYPVYGLIVLFTYGWSLLAFSWLLPSTIKYLTVGELAIMLAYQFYVVFIDSLLALLFTLLISIALPPKWFRDEFIARSSAVIICTLSLLAYLNYNKVAAEHIWIYILIAIGLLVILLILIQRINLLKKIILNLADRSIIFMYLSVPLSAISMVVVLIRNI